MGIMKRSQLTMSFILISIGLIIVSFLFASQLGRYGSALAYIAGAIFILIAFIGAWLAYKEKSGKARRGYSSARTFCLVGALILTVFILLLFSPLGMGFGREGIPVSIDQNIIFLLLWITSGILIVLAGIIYEDPLTKRLI